MEYFDLNIKPVLLDDDAVLKSIIELVKNAIRQYHHQDYLQDQVVAYDAKTSTLKVKDHGTGIKLSDFVEQLAFNQEWMTHGLRNAMSMFVAHQIKTIITSNFGTFTPLIRNKEGISESIPSIFIAYEKVLPTNQPSNNLKDLSNNQDAKHGTTITLSPINKNIVNELKFYFDFLQPWKKVLKTKVGSLLIPSKQKINNLFLDGYNITLEDEHHHNNEGTLTFAYDCNSTCFNQDLFKDDVDPNVYIKQCIPAILQHLAENDKQVIYQQLLNNHHSVEWSYFDVRKVIIEYYAEFNPTNYLLGVWNNEDANFVNFAQDAGKVIIWLPKQEDLESLSNCPIQTVGDYGNNYLLINKPSRIAFSKLSKNQQENWTLFNKFLAYVIANNETIRKGLQANNLTTFNFLLVEEFVAQPETYFAGKNVILVDHRLLDSFVDLMNESSNLMINEVSGIDDESFHLDLGKALLEFTKSLNNQTSNKKLN